MVKPEPQEFVFKPIPKRTYFGDVTTPDEMERSGRVVEVEAHNAIDAHKLITEQLREEEEEFIYQIRTDTGSELPQPVFDYFNGFYPDA